jgi:hypothetical protein
MNSSSTIEYTEYAFRICGRIDDLPVKSIEFKVLALDFSVAITEASKFARGHNLVPKNFSLSWRPERGAQNAFVYTGLQKY